MALPASGAISLSQVNVELSLTAGATISMGASNVRTLFGVASGAISMANGFGKSNRKAVTITLASGVNNYVLNTAKAAGYIAGTTDVTLVINSGVVIGSTSTGTPALVVDTSWAAGDTVSVVNNGVIQGAGGAGGRGGTWSNHNGGNPGAPGSAGGVGIRADRLVSMTNNGTIAGGGGGGGGGGFMEDACCGYIYLAGGGGGGGAGVYGGGGGAAGLAYLQEPSNAVAGSAGTSTGGGAGGAGDSLYLNSWWWGGKGGVGGGRGAAGAAGGYANGAWSQAPGAGGAGGAAVNGNGNITWVATGTRYGAIA